MRSGELVRPNIRLLEPLAQGGMGELWTAWHEGLSVEVAVKLIDPTYVSDEISRGRFRREAESAARLKSPHAVQVLDYGTTEDGVPFIVMELLEGESLGDRLERCPLSLAEAAQVVVEVARALSAAHRRGVVHRDIKPDNIFLCAFEDGFFCKVVDFGVSKPMQQPGRKLTAPGMLVGTPEFMSPELATGRQLDDTYQDLWALAVTAYFALVGELPFDGASPREVLLQVLTKHHVPPSSLRPELTATLDAWFDRALDKDQRQRFQSARELAEHFVSAVETCDDASLGELRFSGPGRPASQDRTLPSLRAEDGEDGDGKAAASASSRHTSVPVTQSEPPALRPSASEPQAAASTSRPRSGRSTVLWVAAGLLVAAMLLVAFTRMTLGTRRAGDSGARASTEPSAPVSAPSAPVSEPSVQAPPILANATSADPAIPATASAQASTAVSARAAPAPPKDFAPRKDYGF